MDTYGVPNYKEANPGLFTCFTFPFLFGMMFGDVGHGLILLSFATILCLLHGKVKSIEGHRFGKVHAATDGYLRYLQRVNLQRRDERPAVYFRWHALEGDLRK